MPDEFQVLFNVAFLKLVAMTECHVQLDYYALIGIQTLNLRITSTRHNPIEPLTFLNCIKPHSQGENLLIGTHQENSKHTFHKRIKGFLERIHI